MSHLNAAGRPVTRRRSAFRPARPLAVIVVLALIAVLFDLGWTMPAQAATGSSCGATINPVVCENSKPGNPESEWQITGAGDATVQGFSTDTSVNVGGTIGFKIKAAAAYQIDIYRLGYYGGNGARKQSTTPITVSSPAVQPTCLSDAATQNFDCGNWSLSASWTVPSTSVSGVYLAVVSRLDTGGSSHIPFVVRDDSSHSDVTYQTSDITWQAYNLYGGSDFYQGNQQLTQTQARAFKISFNRPYITRGTASGRDFLFSNEYPMIRFMEQNGYDVSYQSGVDTDRYGSLLKNHKVFLSIGHDEYWSLPQRLNVEAARDAGVNLMFLSGNEVYWHVRYEPSIDGSNTDYRTIVDYKDTWENAAFDPAAEQTATFRDPRFAAAPGGSNPENGLTGTAYMVNTAASPITVTAAQGKLRIWRNTGLASMGGASTALAPNTVGYESDEDLDNGFRPAGLIDMSTTTFQTDSYLQDFGTVVAPGTSTHHITLYRAPSGALVFGAGTIQWAWGLDSDHDGVVSAPDARIQQATVNLFADMGAQPQTLMSGLVAASQSADTQAPSTTITSPAAGSTIGNSTPVTVTGTSVDNGGGVVGGVEVSLDGGVSWHPATGTTNWTYSGVAHGAGTWSIQARASDDSGNLAAATKLAVNTSCPCTLFGNSTPKQVDGGDTSSVELGVRVSSSADGFITGVRFYKSTANTGNHTGSLWSAGGTLLASGTFTGETASGWQTLVFSSPVAVTADTTYVASYFAPNGHYSADLNSFYYKDYAATPLSAQATSGNGAKLNGVYNVGHGFPTSSFRAANYYVDVLFSASTTAPPSVTAQNPAPNSTGVDTSVSPSATFSQTMDASSIAFTLTDAANNVVPATVGYNSATRTATLTPTSPLAAGTVYTATVNGADSLGNQMSAPVSWTFRTAVAGQYPGACPCTIFNDLTSPSTDIADTGSVELGVKFSSDADGLITGVRFYKNTNNAGVHTGSLWTTGGVQLATGTFTGESASGWQTLTFSSPVSITAGTTYIASYHAPNGHYQATPNAFASAGVNNFPLHVPVGGGLYDYTTGAMPRSQSNADYGVDAVFTVASSTVPAVSSTNPVANASSVAANLPIVLTYNTSLIAGSTAVTVSGPGGAAVAGNLTLDTPHKVLTFTPSASLTAGSTYTVTASGARSLAGTAQASPYTFSFTARSAANCPCGLFPSTVAPAQIDAGDTSSVALGVKFTANATGYISGVQFYKSVGNTGVHTGSLWSAGGARLATGTFTGETPSGWQTLTFANPVPLTVGTVYIVSYYAPNGHYSADPHYFDSPLSADPLTGVGGGNGVYTYSGDVFPSSTFGNTNYWVDPVFNLGTVPDVNPPAIESVTPANTTSSLPTSTVATATFSKAIAPASLVFTVQNGSTAVTGTTTLDGTGTKATFTPAAALARGVTYTASVTASDPAGNAMTAPYTWTFTTMRPDSTPGVCPCSLFQDSSVPAVPAAADTSSVEVGTKFSSDWSGTITGVRFYKSAANTGQHVVSLWNPAGTQLATVTATGETASGWQTATFSTPVAITAGTTYLVSYHTSTGSYAYNSGAYATAGVDAPPLHVPVHGGAYVYGQGFPSNASDANYWVDPVLSANTPAAPSISAVAASGSGTSARVTWTTSTAATSRVDYGTSAGSLNLTASAAGSGTSHSVPLTGLAANTRYYYRVTSVDSIGQSSTSPATSAAPATYIPTATPFTVTTTAQFALGSTGTAANSYVASNGDGEVTLTPTTVAEFTSTSLPAGMTSTANATGGKTTFSGGLAVVSGADLTTTATYASGKSLETLAKLGQNQSIGWRTSSNAAVTMSFTVNSSSQLVATVNDGATIVASSVLASGWTYAAHTYRIEWDANTVTFYVDNVQKFSNAFTSTYTNLRPVFSDTVVGGTGGTDLSVDWFRVGPYAASGNYMSKIFDAGVAVNWTSLVWDATVGTGTTLTVLARTGSTPTADASWTAWTTVASSGASIGKTSRYVQFQLAMTTTGTRYVTPAVRSVTVNYTA